MPASRQLFEQRRDALEDESFQFERFIVSPPVDANVPSAAGTDPLPPSPPVLVHSRRSDRLDRLDRLDHSVARAPSAAPATVARRAFLTSPSGRLTRITAAL